jgi:hypothetical protein
MTRSKILKLQSQLGATLKPFEQAMEKLAPSMTLEDVEPMLQATLEIRGVLDTIKSYFIEVRNLLTDTIGIPPAKELAQLIIGASTESISSLREVQHHLEEFQEKLKRGRKKPISQDELHFAEFGSLTVVRRSHYIINKISEHIDELPADI